MNKSTELCLHICKKRQIYSIAKVKAPFSNLTWIAVNCPEFISKDERPQIHLT